MFLGLLAIIKGSYLFSPYFRLEKAWELQTLQRCLFHWTKRSVILMSAWLWLQGLSSSCPCPNMHICAWALHIKKKKNHLVSHSALIRINIAQPGMKAEYLFSWDGRIFVLPFNLKLIYFKIWFSNRFRICKLVSFIFFDQIF